MGSMTGTKLHSCSELCAAKQYSYGTTDRQTWRDYQRAESFATYFEVKESAHHTQRDLLPIFFLAEAEAISIVPWVSSKRRCSASLAELAFTSGWKEGWVICILAFNTCSLHAVKFKKRLITRSQYHDLGFSGCRSRLMTWLDPRTQFESNSDCKHFCGG